MIRRNCKNGLAESVHCIRSSKQTNAETENSMACPGFACLTVTIDDVSIYRINFGLLLSP